MSYLLRSPFNKPKTEYMMYGLLYVGLFLVNGIINFFINGDIFTAFIFLSFMFLVYKTDSHFWLKYCYVAFYAVYNLLGVFVVENRALFLTELVRYSDRHDSLLLITFTHWLFCFSLWGFEQRWGKNIVNTQKRQEEWYFNDRKITDHILKILGVLLLVFIWLSFIQIWDRPAFSLGYDRFIYEQRVLSGNWYIKTEVAIMYFIPIVALLFLRYHKWLPWFIIASSAVYLFWGGEKFGNFFYMFCFLIPVFLIRNRNFKLNIKFIIIIAFVFLAAIGIVFIHNSLTGGKDFKDNIEYLEQRTAMQGQLWWAIYDQYKDSSLPLDELDDELSTWFDLDSDFHEEYNHGIYKIMRLVTPSIVFYNKISTGSAYSCSTYASIFYYFCIPGLLLFTPFLASLMCIVINWYWYGLLSNSIIQCVIAAKFFNVMCGVIAGSKFDILFSIESLTWLSLAFFWYVFSNRLQAKNRLRHMHVATQINGR